MTSVKEAISMIASGGTLSFEQAASVMDRIMDGESSPVLTSSYLTALAMRGETVDEIAGDCLKDGSWQQGVYTRVHRDQSIINAMRAWMRLNQLTEDELYNSHHIKFLEK